MMLLQLKAIKEESTRKGQGQGGLSVTAEVFEIVPSLNLVELKKSYGHLSLYKQVNILLRKLLEVVHLRNLMAEIDLPCEK